MGCVIPPNIFNRNELGAVKELEKLKKRFKELLKKDSEEYKEKLSVANKQYAEVKAELRRAHKTIDSIESELEKLKIGYTKEKRRVKQK